MICSLCKEPSQKFSCRKCVTAGEREKESKLRDLKVKIENIQQSIQVGPLNKVSPPLLDLKIQEYRNKIIEKRLFIKLQQDKIQEFKEYEKFTPFNPIKKDDGSDFIMDYTLAKARIEELIAMFRLRRVLNKQSIQEVRILYFKFDFTNIKNQKKLNQSVNSIIKFLVLIAQYLNQPLPNPIYAQARMIRFDYSETGLKPLELNERNAEDFLLGLAALNFNIACLCYSQGVQIQVEDTCDTLELLAKLCSSPLLGKLSNLHPDFELADVVEYHQQKVNWEILDFEFDEVVNLGNEDGSDEWTNL